jgi:RNA polymerase sigma-70 factor (ECF subfamily)
LASSSDRHLIERAQRGDVRAFEELIRPHLPGIRRFAYSFRPNFADADDLAQEALIRAFRSLSSFRGESALSTWLYAVARSAFLDWRRGRVAKAQAAEDQLDEAQADESELQDRLVEQKSEAEQLWDALRQLEPRFRVPVVLLDIEGLPYEQIATIEHVPVGTIRSRLSRGRKRLRAILLRARDPDPGTETEEASSNSVRRPVQ